MTQHNPEQDPSATTEALGQATPERSAGDKKLGKVTRGLAAATAVATLLLPNSEVGDMPKTNEAIQAPGEDEATPGYDRGRAEEVMKIREQEQELGALEPTTHGREVLAGESPSASAELVSKGQRNPDFDPSVATRYEGTEVHMAEPEQTTIQNTVDNIMNYPPVSQEFNHQDSLEGDLPGPTEDYRESQG